MSGPTVFDLTPLTKGAAAARRTVIKGFEVRWQVLVVSIFAGLLGLIPTAIFWPLFGSASLLSVLIVIGASIWLIQGRSNKGMRVSNWRTLGFAASNVNGQFMVANVPYDPLANQVGFIHRRALPVSPTLAPQPTVTVDDLHSIRRGRRVKQTASVTAAVNAWDADAAQKSAFAPPPPTPSSEEPPW